MTLDAWVKEEACPHDLAPTTSTTVALALGDALAIALLEEKGFDADDFARLHPGGAIGRRLLTRVSDVMISDNLPVLPESATMREAVVQLAERRGIAIVTARSGSVAGVITTGDLSRLMEHEEECLSVPVTKVEVTKPHRSRRRTSWEARWFIAWRPMGSSPCPSSRMSGRRRNPLHDLMRAGGG